MVRLPHLVAVLACIWLAAGEARAQADPSRAGDRSPEPSAAAEPVGAVRRTLTWVAGGVSGLALHEIGHVGVAAALDADPH